MDEQVVVSIINRFLAGDLQRDDAVRKLLPIGEKYGGLAATGGTITLEQRARLNDLAKALSWEMAKKIHGAAIPDVPYDSPEYRSFLASFPRVIDDDRSGGGTA